MPDLKLVPVSRLTSHGQHFHCAPYDCSISARACLKRRGETYEGGRMRGHTPQEHASYPTCAGCSIGARVAQKLAGVTDPRANEPAPSRRRRRAKRAVAIEGARHAF